MPVDSSIEEILKRAVAELIVTKDLTVFEKGFFNLIDGRAYPTALFKEWKAAELKSCSFPSMKYEGIEFDKEYFTLGVSLVGSERTKDLDYLVIISKAFNIIVQGYESSILGCLLNLKREEFFDWVKRILKEEDKRELKEWSETLRIKKTGCLNEVLNRFGLGSGDVNSSEEPFWVEFDTLNYAFYRSWREDVDLFKDKLFNMGAINIIDGKSSLSPTIEKRYFERLKQAKKRVNITKGKWELSRWDKDGLLRWEVGTEKRENKVWVELNSSYDFWKTNFVDVVLQDFDELIDKLAKVTSKDLVIPLLNKKVLVGDCSTFYRKVIGSLANKILKGVDHEQ
jgi:hypothetical protein